MSRKQVLIGLFVGVSLLACSIGCGRGQAKSVAHVDEPGAAGASDRIDIPGPVRQNLGMTFVTAEARRVEATLRVAGAFEYLPTARREHHAMLPGRIDLLVSQYDRVEVGDELFQIDSPAWRELQRELVESESSIERHSTRLASFGPLRDAHRNHERLLEQIIVNRRERVAQLERAADAGGGRSASVFDARAELTAAEAALAEVLEKEAELAADEQEAVADLAAARRAWTLLIRTASTVSGLDQDTLQSVGTQGLPVWSELSLITVRASEAGFVETLGVTDGSWAGHETAVVTLVRPDLIRFRAVGLQSDLGRLRDGLHARIVAPSPTKVSGSIGLGETMEGVLSLGLAADAGGRTIDLIVVPETQHAWARPGVSALLEIVVDGGSEPAISIPLASVQRDGLGAVFFRRDPKNPDVAIRVNADLGVDDGRWVAVRSGLRLGDEVVLDGAFQLMLASSSEGPAKGGHFHADGTFHSDDHDE